MEPIKHAYLNKIHIELVLMYLILFLVNVQYWIELKLQIQLFYIQINFYINALNKIHYNLL